MTTITHITSVHPRKDTRILLKECRTLAENFGNINLIVSDGLGNEKIGSVCILDAGKPPKNRIERLFITTPNVIKKAISTKADIYHIHDPELLLFFRKLLRNGKVVYDSHEDMPQEIKTKPWIPPLFRPLLSLLTQKIEDFVSSRVNGIVAATPFIKKRFLKINANTIDINNYPLNESICQNVRHTTKENIACYVGDITAVRGIENMIKGISHTQGKLLLMGSFSSPGGKNNLKQLPGWDQVIELGFCDRPTVLKNLASSTVGLVLFKNTPNHINAQPNKLFEYMAAGIPVLASNFPLWEKIISEAQCGICVNPDNHLEIGRALNWFFKNPGKSLKMGQEGRSFITKKINWETEGKKLISFYNDL